MKRNLFAGRASRLLGFGRELARRLLCAGLLLAPCGAFAASTLRLVYGESWSKAGRDVKAKLSSGEFRSALKGRYVTDFVDEEGGNQAEKNLGSLKLPALFLISELGNCFAVIEGLKSDWSTAQLVKKVRQIDDIRLEAEKSARGFPTAEACGDFLQKMERYVGGPRRVISKGFYDDVFEKLKKLDPNDETGWIRHFTLGEEFDRGTKADGLELVIRANAFREKGQMTEGERFIEGEMKKPRAHLSKEQVQGILMAKFALFRDDASKTEEMNRILTKVADFDETTFWGTAAVGWMNVRGLPPLSTYWGWHKGDFKGAKVLTTVKYGVDCRFPRAGRYTIAFVRDEGAADAPRFESLQLLTAGKDVIATLTKPEVRGNVTTFACDLPREYRGRVKAMVVKGAAGASGDSTGKIVIHRKVLRDRGTGGGAPSLALSKAVVVTEYIAKTVGKETLAEIGRREGGAAFLKAFFSDPAWMESFAGSGMWDNAPWKGLKDNPDCAAKALKALDLLVWNDKDDFIGTKTGRNIATALALDHGKDWDDEKLVRVMECYREWAKAGTLVDDAAKYDVRKWREVLGFGQNAGQSVEDMIWIHDFANFAPERYYGLCWCCAYRDHNCFGDDVQGPHYYRPWEHRWQMQEMRYRVGGVCGALSKFGSFGAASHGIRSFTAGQPGHCAYLLWDYPSDIWGIAYAVTAHTGPHNSLGGPGFAAVQEQNRYYLNPKRMVAEAFRWKGDYTNAMANAFGNYQAGVAWYNKLEAKNASQEEWDVFGGAVAKTMNGFPSQGWALYLAYLGKLAGRDAKLAAAKRALGSIRESNAKTFENPYWDEIALDPLDKMFPNDDEAMWQVFEAALEGQAKTPSFWRQTVSWGSGRLMKKDTKRYLALVGKSALKAGEKLDFSSMIRAASEAEDLAMWRQVYALMDKLNAAAAPKANGKGWPKEQYGGALLSADGLLKISNTSQWDSPVTYRNALTAGDFEGGNAFHTGKNNAPWAMVVLPGSSDISGITVVNSGGAQNGGRQVPLRIWLSDDGKDWKEVFASDQVSDEWKCALPARVKAKYVKVGRANDPSSGEHLFHLHKILVYGKKLY